MVYYDKRAPQQDTEEENPGGDTTFTQLDATSMALEPTTTTTPFEGDTVTTTATLEDEATTTTQSVPEADITPVVTTTTESLSSGLFTVLTQMTLAPSSSSLPPSVSGSTIIASRPISSYSSYSVRPTVITPASASSVNSVPNGLLMFTFMVILFMRFFKYQ